MSCYDSGIHPGQYPLYNPGALSQLDRERLSNGRKYIVYIASGSDVLMSFCLYVLGFFSGIPGPHHVGLDPNDPMVS